MSNEQTTQQLNFGWNLEICHGYCWQSDNYGQWDTDCGNMARLLASGLHQKKTQQCKAQQWEVVLQAQQLVVCPHVPGSLVPRAVCTLSCSTCQVLTASFTNIKISWFSEACNAFTYFGGCVSFPSCFIPIIFFFHTHVRQLLLSCSAQSIWSHKLAMTLLVILGNQS